jgi:hypothetical protein
MVTKDLLTYISTSIQQGREPAMIRQSLVDNGWNPADVDEALHTMHMPTALTGNTQKPAMQSLPSTALLISQAWIVYKSNFKRIVKLIVFYLLIRIGFVLFSLAMGLVILFLSRFALGSLFIFVTLAITGICMLAFGVLLILIDACFYTSFLLLLSQKEEKTSIWSLCKKSYSFARSYIILSCVTGFLTIGGILFFFIPGLLFLLWSICASYVLVYEDVRGMNAFMLSKYYVKGHALNILVKCILIGVLFFGLNFVIEFIPGLFTPSISAIQLPKELANFAAYSGYGLKILASVLGWLLSTFTLTPLSSIVFVLLYYHLKEMKPDPPLDIFSRGNKMKIILVSTLGIILFLVLTGGSIYASISNAFKNPSSLLPTPSAQKTPYPTSSFISPFPLIKTE